MGRKRSFTRVLAVSTLVGCLEVALAAVVVLLYVRTQPPPDTPPDGAATAAALVSLVPLVGFASFLLSLVFVLPAVALTDLIARGPGRGAAWWWAPPAVAALLSVPVVIVATYNDADTGNTLLFWAAATVSLSLGAVAALPRRDGLLRRIALWGTAVVAGTGLFGALGLAVGLLPAYEPPRIGAGTMTGSWVDRTGNSLVFTPDGRVTASGVGGRSPVDHPLDPAPSCSGSGTWVYEGGRDVRAQKVRIAVPGCAWPAWSVGGTAREPRIRQEIGGPGSGRHYELRKVPDRT
ncbi:hypothetical protein [Streptomyces sp. NRRL F-2664]|uniref:hypothetical protein n=1 Tax=Streptomyces sp. NRRL F-2664 TaxID=1463842 RepID=UPI00068E8E3C|nr:hypothetical protein [Streptomyces sp. NRRL F-2664]